MWSLPVPPETEIDPAGQNDDDETEVAELRSGLRLPMLIGASDMPGQLILV